MIKFSRRVFQLNLRYFYFGSIPILQFQQQITKYKKEKFKLFSLISEINKVNIRDSDYTPIINALTQIEIESQLNETIQNIQQQLITYLQLQPSLIKNNDFLQLLTRIYQYNEIAYIKKELGREESINIGMIELQELLEKWPTFQQLNTAQRDILQIQVSQQSYFLKIKQKIQVNFENFDFHQYLYYSYLRMCQDEDLNLLKSLVKAFGKLNPKSLDGLDMQVLAKILKFFFNTYGFCLPVEQLIRKFDHYIEKMDNILSPEDRMIILLDLQDIDFPSKIALLSQSIQLSEIPKKYFAIAVYNLLQYHDPTEIISIINERLDSINKFEDQVNILLGLVWVKEYNPIIFKTLMIKINNHFSHINNIVFDMKQNFLTSCCILYQIIYSLQVENQDQIINGLYSNVNMKQLEQLYFKRMKMINNVDISRSEQEVVYLLQELKSKYNIIKVERQVKVALFSVDFRVTLKNTDTQETKTLLLDLIGGSSFLGKKGMNRKNQWRIDLISRDNLFTYINITEWNSFNKQQKLEKISKCLQLC